MSKLSLRGWGGPFRLVCAAALLGGVAWAAGCGDGATEPAPATPDPPRPTTVMVSPATAALTALGATVQLTAEVRDQNGQAMASATVTWASGSAEVATVSSSGLVTAAGNGTATVTATAGSVSGTATVTVAQEVATVAVSPDADTLVAGDTVRLAAAATDANGHAVAESEFMWASSDTAVATVDASGLATSVGAGETEVTATASGITGRAVLTVVNPAPAAITVTPDTVALTALGQTAQLTAQVHDQIGRVMEGVPVSWSSADATVAAVDSAGLVTAIGSGTATVTASADEASGDALVMVMQAAGSVVVSPAADTIAPGDTLQLAAQAFDENGNAVAGAEFTWSSSDGSVAVVNASGLVQGVAGGKTTITAASGDARGTAEITVANPDRAALAALYNATDGPNWRNNENWLTDAPLEEWYGVETDVAGRVNQLNLASMWNSDANEYITQGLRGLIPPEVGNLTALRALRLTGNDLSGPIPPEIGNLAALASLRLRDNALSGSIPPELLNLADLRSLDLRGNDLTGVIPPEVGNLAALSYLDLADNALSGPIPPGIGNLTALRTIQFDRNDLSGPIPPEIGNLAALRSLWLGGNNLSGPVPPEIGNLAALEFLWLGGNPGLSGALPTSMLALANLSQFATVKTGLCVPDDPAFRAWLATIPKTWLEERVCGESDRAVLEALYRAAGGADWVRADNWLTDAPMRDWHGVSTDPAGWVNGLDLARNGLAGSLPSSLSTLTHLNVLRIGGNTALTGRLPFTLTRLPLREFRYADTRLCVPPTATFQAWLTDIHDHEGTGVECEPLSEKAALEALYNGTAGPEWLRADNWLTDAPLRDWHGVSVNGQSAVVSLDLSGNALGGPLPPEIGSLAALEYLNLGDNALTGTLPPEIGNLDALRYLRLSGNALEGDMPLELGNLAKLTALYLGGNDLYGPIPPELGKLAALEDLWLGGNNLTVIPPELGKLAALERLQLSGNAFTGTIPSELGKLGSLEALWLGACKGINGLIPPELGRLTTLRRLSLSGNDLRGRIPPELGNLAALEALNLGDNDLTGSIPPELGNLDGLNILDLSDNDLTGSIPPELGSLASLEHLSLTGNDIAGSIPPELGNLASLKWLDLANNAIAGGMPPKLGNLPRLERLYASNNLLAGSIPPQLGGMAALRHLYLSGTAPSTCTTSSSRCGQRRDDDHPKSADRPALAPGILRAPGGWGTAVTARRATRSRV